MDDGKDRIWDPLRRKVVAATPEEMVRQWFVTVLHNDCGVPLHMMMSEVPMTFGKKRWRADIVVYGRDARPVMVVECKRPEVELGREVMSQALRYDNVLGVKVAVVTNGRSTMAVKLGPGGVSVMDHLPVYSEILSF